MFLPFENLNKLSTPKSITSISYDAPICLNADTVILNGQFEKVKVYTYYRAMPSFHLPKYVIKSIELPEGLDSISLWAQHPSYSSGNFSWEMEKLVLPSTITKIADIHIKQGNIISKIENPENILITNYSIAGDTIFVPEGTREKYLESPFKYMKVIREMDAPKSLSLGNNLVKMFLDEIVELSVSMNPEGAFYKELKWESSNDDVVKVSQEGIAKAIAPGTATIKASSKKNPAASDQCQVTVFEHTTGVCLSMYNLEINVNETKVISAHTLPLETSDNRVSWSSSDENIATVDEVGNVKGIKTGDCVIRATSVDGGYVAECSVSVVQPAKSVSLNKESTSITVGNSETLVAIVSPDDTTDKTVKWSSSNTDVVEVDASGLVTARKAGKATISAVAVSNSEAKASCEVTVIQPVTGISLSETSLTMTELGTMKQLIATVLPEDATNKAIKWTSSNTSVCTVSENGTVVAVGYGTSVIVVTTTDGGYPATCVVNVVQPVVVTANSYTRKYGEANPVFEYQAEGGTLKGEPQIVCEAMETSPVGVYPIIITKGTITNSVDSYVNGTLTITKAPLNVLARNYTIKQGEAFPSFEADYSGFMNNETSDVLTRKPTLNTTITNTSVVGNYDIIVSGAEAQNYEMAYTNGVLRILSADALIVTVKSYAISYGDDLPIFEYTTEGATINGTPEITCSATKMSSVGTYPIIITKGSITNYNDTYVNGILTITKAPLTISAGDYTMMQGKELPEFSASYTGFKNGESNSVLLKQPVLKTNATSNSEPGTYVVTVSEAQATNYDIKYVNGILTISPSSGILTVSLEHPSDVYTLQGIKVRSKVTSLKGIPNGIYLINGRKIVINH